MAIALAAAGGSRTASSFLSLVPPWPHPSFFSFFALHPHGPATYVLVAIPSALITSQQDGARISNGIKVERRRREKSQDNVWNLPSECGICKQTECSHCPYEQSPELLCQKNVGVSLLSLPEPIRRGDVENIQPPQFLIFHVCA